MKHCVLQHNGVSTNRLKSDSRLKRVSGAARVFITISFIEIQTMLLLNPGINIGFYSFYLFTRNRLFL